MEYGRTEKPECAAKKTASADFTTPFTRSGVLTSALLALAAAALPAAAAEAASNIKPNIVLFLVNDRGWMDTSVNGSKYYETPNMERLARHAMRFTNAYAAPLC